MNLIKTLHDIGAVKTGEFILKSGVTSPIYIDLRIIISYPKVLHMIAQALWEKISPLNPSLLCGVPYAALPIATAISLAHDVPMIMCRKETKEYGTKRKVDGIYRPHQACIIIEDVVTSGSSLLETIKDLEEAGLMIRHVVCVIDRQQGGKENLAQQGVELLNLLTLSEL